MLSFLKTFGLGVLYVILLPVIALFFVLYAIYCIFVYFVMFIIAVVKFFKGESIFDPLPEDIIAQERMATMACNAGPASTSSSIINPTETRKNDENIQDDTLVENTPSPTEVQQNNETNNVIEPQSPSVSIENDDSSNTIIDKTGDDVL